MSTKNYQAFQRARHSAGVFVFLFLLLWALGGTHTHAAALVPFGSTWKFLDDGSNQATNQSNLWRTADFEDDGWGSGPAQFGYGDGDETTEVG